MNPIIEHAAETDVIDPDIALLGDYLARALTPEQSEALEARLAADAAFYEKAEPLLELWGSGLDFREVLERYQREHGAIDVAKSEPVPRTTIIREPKRWRGWRLYPGRRSLLQLAAVIVLVVGGAREYDAKHKAALQAEIAPDIAAFLLAAEVPIEPGALTEFRTNHGQTLTFTLADSSVVELRSNSRLSYGAVKRVAFGVRATLVGEAAIVVSARERAMLVETPAGRVLLTPGAYAIRTELARGAVLVTAARGHAMLLGATATAVRLIGAGQFGWIHEGEPQITSGYQYPPLNGARK